MIGLYQVDGKWPNLALMHLAGWFREHGERVARIGAIEQEMCAVVYASKIFSDSDASGVSDRAIRGGTGWADWRSLPPLPDEIEHCYPAYDLWDEKRAIGFLTRGCIRRCPFCFVPEKEGIIRHHAHLSEWWRGQDHICLLDANITGHPDVLGYLDELAQSGARVDFSQGVDVRLMTEEIARALAKIRRYKQLHIAWDNPKEERPVLAGIRILGAAMPKGSLMAYVLVGYNSSEEEDIHRVSILRDLGIDPFVMPYNKRDEYQRRFARWVNHKAIFKSVSWREYATQQTLSHSGAQSFLL